MVRYDAAAQYARWVQGYINDGGLDASGTVACVNNEIHAASKLPPDLIRCKRGDRIMQVGAGAYQRPACQIAQCSWNGMIGDAHAYLKPSRQHDAFKCLRLVHDDGQATRPVPGYKPFGQRVADSDMMKLSLIG